MPPLSERAGGGGVAGGRVERAALLAGRELARAELALRRLPVPSTRLVLGGLIVLDWLLTADVARIAAHRGWLFYDGGDSTWYYTSAWVLAHGHIPLGSIGFAYSLLIAPVTWFAGANILHGLPPIVILNAALLAPIEVLCIYALAKAIGGIRFAYVCALAWVVFPLAAIRYFYPTYHLRYVDVTLPSAVGLTALGDFPSMVCTLVAAYFTYRALSSASRLDGLTAGLAAGLMVAVKPANALFLPAAVLALALARRPRQLAFLAAGLAPSLLALALWKFKGLGTLPIFAGFSTPATTFAAGVHPALPAASFSLQLGKYFYFDWSHLLTNIDGLREFGWSERLVIWLTLAGLLGLTRRSLPGAVLVGGWLATYLVIKGSDPLIGFTDGNFFNHLLPAVPAFFLLAMCVVFLVPVYGRRRLVPSQTQSWPSSRRSRQGVIAVLGLLAFVPIAIFALLPALDRPGTADLIAYGVLVPSNQFPLSATTSSAGVKLSWPLQSTNDTEASYLVFRSRQDLSCTPVAHAASQCSYGGAVVGVIPPGVSAFRDRPPAGRWSYRVALGAAAMGPADAAEPLLLSSAAAVTVGG